MRINPEYIYPGYNYYTMRYTYIPLGLSIRKQIGKTWIYQWTKGKQRRLKYYRPTNPRSDRQQDNRAKIRYGVWAWRDLTENEKNWWRKKEGHHQQWSGYNFFLSDYILSLS